MNPIQEWSLLSRLEVSRGLQWSFGEHWHDTHHLGSSDSLADFALVLARESSVTPGVDSSHFGNEIGKQTRVEAMLQRVRVQLMEEIPIFGF